jgi:hypothetical protein
MLTSRVLSLFVTVAVGCATATPLSGQGILNRVRQGIGQVTEFVQDAQGVMCKVERACATIQAADYFSSASYESVAVTTFDGTRAFESDGALGLVRDAFEGTLVAEGFMLAANSNPEAVQALVARGDGNWGEAELVQLRQFITGVDAVIVVHIRQVDVGRCELPDGSRGRRATIHLAVRWLNVDGGDIPWVATHYVAACARNADTAQTNALRAAATQLAAMLPKRSTAP